MLDAADANSLHAGELQSAARSTAALAQDFQSSLDAANAKIPTTFYTDAKLTLAAHAARVPKPQRFGRSQAQWRVVSPHLHRSMITDHFAYNLTWEVAFVA